MDPNKPDPEAGTTLTPEAGSDNAGTPSTVDAGSGSEEMVSVPKREFLALKEKREGENSEARRLAQDVADLRSKVEAGLPPTPGTPPAQDDPTDKRTRNINRLRQLAESGNEDADAVVSVLDQAEALNRAAIARLELADIPKADHPAVLKLMEERRIASPAVAHRFIKGERLDPLMAEVERLKQENAELKKGPTREPAAPTRMVGQPPTATAQQGGKVRMAMSDFKKLAHSKDPAVRRKALADDDAGLLDIYAD